MSVADEVKALQQQARDLERATLVQISHLVRAAVPAAKTFVVVLEVRGHEQLQATFEVPAYTEGSAYEWDDQLTDEELAALRELELLIAGAPKFNVVGERTVTIAKLIGDNAGSTADEQPRYDDEQEAGQEEPEPEVEIEPIRQTEEGGWEVDLRTQFFRGVLVALPLEDGEFFVEIAAASTGADITTIDATGEPNAKVRVKVSTNQRRATLSEDAEDFVQALLQTAQQIPALSASIESMGQVVVSIS